MNFKTIEEVEKKVNKYLNCAWNNRAKINELHQFIFDNHKKEKYQEEDELKQMLSLIKGFLIKK